MTKYKKEELIQHRKDLVAALRSGKYKQGMAALRDKENNYCCLGVACEISGVKFEIEQDGSYYYIDGDFNHNGTLNNKSMTYFGFSDMYGGFDFNSLVGLNDSGETFDMIASIIEDNPDGLFIKGTYNE